MIELKIIRLLYVKKGTTMIYITGDTHADFSRFEEVNFPIQNEIICQQNLSSF